MRARLLLAAVTLIAALTGFPAAASAVIARVPQGYVYWANRDSDSIGRVAAGDPSHPDQNFVTVAGTPGGVAVANGYVYWSNIDSGTIGRARLSDPAHPDQNFITGV